MWERAAGTISVARTRQTPTPTANLTTQAFGAPVETLLESEHSASDSLDKRWGAKAQPEPCEIFISGVVLLELRTYIRFGHVSHTSAYYLLISVRPTPSKGAARARLGHATSWLEGAKATARHCA